MPSWALFNYQEASYIQDLHYLMSDFEDMTVNTANEQAEKAPLLETKVLGGIEFPPRKVWMKTFGCQMNYHDSERILSHLKELNFVPTEEKEDADLVLFNTCAIRELANNKFYSQLGEIKKQKKKKNGLVVGVGGCVAQTEGKELIKRFKHLDFAFGTDVIDQINDMVYRTYAGETKFSVNSWEKGKDYSLDTEFTHGSPSAFVNIIKGCDKFCSYCVVPFTRGREKSRSLDEIVNDVARMVQYQGIQEVTLLGQNVNSYGKHRGETLGQLIQELNRIEGLELIRYTTSHPYDITDDLIQAHRDCRKLAPHLHLPIQSGSNTVLQRMLREYTREHYMDLVAEVRKARPDMVITTDIIVGFPNETEAEFQDTLRLLEEVQFDFIYAYKFSVRKGTKAARMKDFLSLDVKAKRLRIVQNLQNDIQEKIRANMVGKTYRLLIDGRSQLHGETRWKGRTLCNRIVHLDQTPELEEIVATHGQVLWNWVDIEITKSTALAANGRLVHFWGKKLPTLGR
jgi:tRNA-2-methylthio-N6-dimethylallyladenosine synthase